LRGFGGRERRPGFGWSFRWLGFGRLVAIGENVATEGDQKAEQHP
jgi:hypothetical protein